MAVSADTPGMAEARILFLLHEADRAISRLALDIAAMEKM
jgi:hypothetical protein